MVVAEGAINLVTDQEDFALPAEQPDRLHFLCRRDDAGRVAWRVDHNAFRSRGDGGGDTGNVEAKVGVGIDKHRRSPCNLDEVSVHDEIGVEDDHLVTRIDDRTDRQREAGLTSPK